MNDAQVNNWLIRYRIAIKNLLDAILAIEALKAEFDSIDNQRPITDGMFQGGNVGFTRAQLNALNTSVTTVTGGVSNFNRAVFHLWKWNN